MKDEKKPNIVLIGGGHTHALVMNSIAKESLENAEITVINPGETAPYSGMLPGFVAGHYSREELDINLSKISKKSGINLRLGKAEAIDTIQNRVQLDDGSEITYDIASIDVGITTRMPSLTGFTDHAVPAKPLDNFSSEWDQYRSSVGSKNVIIIGGGIAGVELAMAMAFALRSTSSDVSVMLFDRENILSTNSDNARKCLRKELKTNNVNIMEHVNVVEITSDGVKLADGSFYEANFVVGVAGATPHKWLEKTGLDHTNGFIDVNNTLQTSQSNVFAVGDCAHMTFDPRPKAGVYAVRQAPILLQNIRNMLSGSALVSYEPQSDYLKLVSLGGKRAFGEKNGFRFSGKWIWKLKNHIDKDFMNQF